MSDIKLFRVHDRTATEIQASASGLERPLQTQIEENLDELLGVRFLASEHSTGKTHAGRIDTLGIDENDCPVILEYKRSVGENVINQGLFYLDWLMDHKAEFQLLVMKRYGAKTAEIIDWSGPRLICIASDFTKYDAHAVQQINRNIELIRYRRFGADLMLLELVNAVGAAPASAKPAAGANKVSFSRGPSAKAGGRGSGSDKTVVQWLTSMSKEMRALFDSLEGFVTSLGDDVQRKDLKLYIAFKRIRNFVTVVFKRDQLLLNLHLDPTAQRLEDGFSRNVRGIGHWGTGDLELTIKNHTDLERAKAFVLKAYEG